MKDIVLKSSVLRREAVCFGCCFCLAFLLNAGAVIAYRRPAVELWTQLGYVLLIGTGVYLLLWLPRLIVRIIARLIKKPKHI